MFKKKLFKVLLTVTCFIVVILAYFLITSFEKDEKKNEDVLAYVETTLSEDTTESTERHFYVDVKGEVKSPGVYFVSEGMLVIDQTTPNMIQRLSGIFARNPLIYGNI